MSIRKFSGPDYPAIIEIYALSKLDELKYETRSFELLPLDQDKKREPALKASDVYVFDSGKIEGYGAVFQNEIRALFVHPQCRGQGVGTALLEWMLSLVKGPAVLYIAKSNTPARRLYEKYRFVISGEFETEYNGVPVLANKMQRPLEEKINENPYQNSFDT